MLAPSKDENALRNSVFTSLPNKKKGRKERLEDDQSSVTLNALTNVAQDGKSDTIILSGAGHPISIQDDQSAIGIFAVANTLSHTDEQENQDHSRDHIREHLDETALVE